MQFNSTGYIDVFLSGIRFRAYLYTPQIACTPIAKRFWELSEKVNVDPLRQKGHNARDDFIKRKVAKWRAEREGQKSHVWERFGEEVKENDSCDNMCDDSEARYYTFTRWGLQIGL